jgi:BolA protein
MSRKSEIEQQLAKELSPAYLNVENESGNHHVPEGSETHFKVTVVSSGFKGLTRIARHRIVNQLLKNEFDTGLHALSMHLYTEDEWEQKSGSVLKSPACKDGYKNG